MSARYVPQRMSIKDECMIYIFLKFLIIGLRNSKANSFFFMEMNIYIITIKTTATDTMTIMGAKDTKK